MQIRSNVLVATALVACVWSTQPMAQQMGWNTWGAESTGSTPNVENTSAYPVHPANSNITAAPYASPMARQRSMGSTTGRSTGMGMSGSNMSGPGSAGMGSMDSGTSGGGTMSPSGTGSMGTGSYGTGSGGSSTVR